MSAAESYARLCPVVVKAVRRRPWGLASHEAREIALDAAADLAVTRPDIHPDRAWDVARARMGNHARNERLRRAKEAGHVRAVAAPGGNGRAAAILGTLRPAQAAAIEALDLRGLAPADAWRALGHRPCEAPGSGLRRDARRGHAAIRRIYPTREALALALGLESRPCRP